MYLIKTDRFIMSFGMARNIRLDGSGGCAIKYQIDKPRFKIKSFLFLFNLVLSGCFYKWYWYFQIRLSKKYKRNTISINELKQKLLKNE